MPKGALNMKIYRAEMSERRLALMRALPDENKLLRHEHTKYIIQDQLIHPKSRSD